MYRALVLLLVLGPAFGSAARAHEETAPSAEQVRRWIADLESDDLRDRWYAAYALGKAGPAAAEAVEPLMTLLANLAGHEYVRGTAAWALGRIGPQADQAVPLLIETLGSAHISVRRNAPRALGEIGTPAATAAVSELLALLEDPDREVRANTAVAVWRLARSARSIPALDAMLAEGGWFGAYEAAIALGQLDGAPPEAVLGPLAGAFAHPDVSVRRAAARSAGSLEGPALPVLEELLNDPREEVRQAAAEALGWIGPPAVDALAAALRRDCPTVRRLAARALGRLGSAAAEAEPALVAALADPHPEVRQAVARAIREVRAGP